MNRFDVISFENPGHFFRNSGVKEAVAIKKIKPTLNKDQGRYHLSSLYDNLIRSSVAMKTSGIGAKDGSEGTDF